jgi:hypothetical protein
MVTVTAGAWLIVFHHFVIKPQLGNSKGTLRCLQGISRKIGQQAVWLTPLVAVLVLVGVVGFILWDVWGAPERLAGVCGLCTFFALLCSLSYRYCL